MTKEIRKLAKESNRSVSWWVQRAWLIARGQLHNPQEEEKAEKVALDKLRSLRGSLKERADSVQLSHSAFKQRK